MAVRNQNTFRIGIFLVLALLVTGGLGAMFYVQGNRESWNLDELPTHRVAINSMMVTITEQGTLESGNNVEIKCKVRGDNTVTFVVESGTEVQEGDELVRLDTLFIEEQIAERTKFAHMARSVSERSAADVRAAKLAIDAYREGTFRANLKDLESQLAIAESQLRSWQNILGHYKMMAESGYVSELDVEQRLSRVQRAKLDVEVKRTQIDVLSKYTQKQELKRLEGQLASATARHEADKERAFADEHRRLRAVEERKHCVVVADRAGMVIHPSAAKWKDAPEISEGATVHKEQTLLLMPDLMNMQVKVGVHESMVKRVNAGMPAMLTLAGRKLKGSVKSVASVTDPAGWWTGNVVKYDTVVALPPAEGLKPGMSAEVEIILATHNDVLTVPVAAIVESLEGFNCWVRAGGAVEKRSLKLGDSNDMFIIVREGLKAGEDVILNPLAHIEEAQELAERTLDETPLNQNNYFDSTPQLQTLESSEVNKDGE